LDFLGRFSQMFPIPNFTENHPVGSAMIHPYRRMDIKKVTGAFHDYENLPKTQFIQYMYIKSEIISGIKMLLNPNVNKHDLA
jgi:hypothetical protein